MQLSQAVLSRIETGERSVSQQEALEFLQQIDSPEAKSLASALTRTWQLLPPPPLDHAEQDLLWEADKTASDLMELLAQLDTAHPFARRIREYIEEIKHGGALLLKREHQIAFIGSIGVGKSTALCRLLGLEAIKGDGSRMPALEVGGGGTTVCEVHIRTGPGYGLMVEPRTETELCHHVEDLADQALRGIEHGSAGVADSHGISKEVSRAIRNMGGVALQRIKQSDGTRLLHDPLVELGLTFPKRWELVIEIQSRMQLHQRDRRDIWYDSSSGKPPMTWLKETFSSINNGLNKEFAFPKRIEVVVPAPVLNVADLTVRLIDTKGIDSTTAREDLEYHLYDPHTLVVLCSNFNNAPAAEARLLIERSQDAGNHNLKTHVAILVFPRPGEALAMKDDATSQLAETAKEGYELKADQIRLALSPLRLDGVATSFFNALEDPPSDLQRFLAAQISGLRLGFRERLRAAIGGARSLLGNHDKKRARAVAQELSYTMHGWVITHAKMEPINSHIQDSLLAEIHLVNASTIRASIRRQGEWSHLSYAHLIGYGARQLTHTAIAKAISEFHAYCDTLLSKPNYAEASDLIQQAKRVFDNSYEELLKKVQLAAQSMFREAFQADPSFWHACLDEWSNGPGYKQRVADHNREWFDSLPRREMEKQLIALIEREWKKTLQSVTELLDLSRAEELAQSA